MTAALIVVAFAAGLLAGALGIASVLASRQRAGEPEPVDDSRFRQAIQRLGAAFAARDRDAIVEVILETAVLAVGADMAVLYVTPSSRSPLTARAAHGASLDGLGLPAGAGLAGRAATFDEPVRWPGGVVPPAPGEPPAHTGVAVPIHSGGRLAGVVAVYSTGGSPELTPADLATLVTVVRQAETAIDNVVLHEEAERLSITDGLTGVWNRRHLDMRAGEELRRARRFGEPFALVLLDVDNFKSVNDTYGHAAGDAVLVELAGRLTAAVREVDTVARWGGEEFCLLLPRTDVEGAAQLAEKVRHTIASSPFSTEAAMLDVTVSAGVACHPAHGSKVPALMAAVDAALYRAKGAGKNRVEVAEPSGVNGGSLVEGSTG